MKSTEVYREINSIVFPTLKSNGFKKTKSGMLGFYKKLKSHYFIIWFQCSQDGFDQYAGSKFIVETQIGNTAEIGAGLHRHRIPYFLTESELDKIKITENEIKDKLHKPPKTHFIFTMSEDVQKWYKKKFEKDNTTYTNSSDIWFIYFDTIDIHKWVRILEPIIDRIIVDYEKSDY
ncbi:MAG: hypothetical protein QM763_12815 [Agriterribacter sp.]